MPDQSSIFPAFIRAEYDGSGSGFALFEKEAGESAARARRQFETNFAEVERVVNGAISRGLKPNGAMDLGVDGFRQAAAQARAYEQSLRTTREAAQNLAVSTGDTSAATHSYLQALNAQVTEASRARQEAEAQVTTYSRLQAEIDGMASRNTALAASYRELYAEQARAARDEVRGRRAQEGYDAVFAPGLTRSAASNGAGFEALEAQFVRQQSLIRDLNDGVAELEQRFAREAAEQARSAEFAAAALQKQTAALEELRRAEAGAANGAAMLNAIMRETGAGAGGGGSAAASASVFEQHFAEQARAAEQYANALDKLQAELDPMYAAQQRFNQALDTADDLLKANIIDQRMHASAVQHARDQLQAHSQAVHNQTDAYQQLTRGSGVLRQAYVQTGQQMQDIVISLYGGQRASVVFAQQLPQLAFALSGLGIQADGTQKGIGRIAALLSGPVWGLAFTGAAAVVGMLVGKLWEQDEASQAAEDAAKKHKQAIDALDESLNRAVQTAEQKARADYEMAYRANEAAAATERQAQAMLNLAQADLAYRVAQTRGPGTARSDVATAGIASAVAEVKRLEQALEASQKRLDQAEQRLRNAEIVMTRPVLESANDPIGRANIAFDRRQAAIKAEYDRTKDRSAYNSAMVALDQARDAEIKRIQETQKALNSSGSAREKEAATVNQVSKMLIESFGGTITSTTGGKHVKGSYHYKGQAVDFVPAGGMGAITKEQIRAGAEAAGLQIKELLGPGDKGHSDHFHLAWAGGKNEINSQRIADQLAREAERRAAEAQRVAEELDRAARTLISRFDEGRASALDYADGLKEINRLLAAGAITPDDAMQFEVGLAQQKTANDNDRDQRFMDELDKALWGDRKRPTQEWEEQIENEMKRAAEYARQIAIQMDVGLQAVSDTFGYGAARVLDMLTRFAPVDSGLGTLLAGVGVGNSDFLKEFSNDIGGVLEEVFGKDRLKSIGEGIGEVMGAAGIGATAGGLVLGSSNNKLGSAIGGAVGKEAGDALGKLAGGLLGKLGGPLGSIAGGILGGAIGGLFTSTKWGTAAVTGNGDSDVSVGGNKSAYRSNSSLAATSIQSGLDAIAEQFGVDVGGYNVSIGQYKGKWRVSTTGRTGKLKGGSSRTDIKDFGEEGAEDAIKYAIADAVKDGALQGLRASTQALLAASDDVEAQLQKALDFEDVFSRLKSYKDPVGAALDTLDKEFKRLQGIFEEAGASAEEYAQLEELYGIERAAAVKEAAEKVTASLQSLFDDLTVGNDARSLRDRLVEAQAAYSPLAQRVAAGDTTAYDDYADAAQTLLDLQRQIYGSSEEYFQLLDQVTALTKTRIDAESNIASISEARDSIFASDSSLAPVVSATESQTAQLVSAFQSASAEQTAALVTALNLSQATLNQISAKLTGSAQSSNNLGYVARNNF